MILYKLKNKSEYIVQLGLGLIGSSIFESFENRKFIDPSSLIKRKLSWQDTNKVNSTQKELLNYLVDKSDSHYTIHLIWSAGKTGFLSTKQQCDQEVELFRKTLNLFNEKISDSYNLKIYFFSSAGGLFEGSNVSSFDQVPLPQRPYGFQKIQQEQIVHDTFSADCITILRPSSVYTISPQNKRQGLLSVLIKNGLKNRVTTIYAKPTTIRDYILAEDIGHWLSDCIYYTRKLHSIEFLISGLPISIHYIQSIIEEYLNKPLFLNYKKYENEANISYSSDLKPKYLKITPFKYSIKKYLESIDILHI